MRRRMRIQFPLLALGLLALLAGMWGGLLRLGWSWPILAAPLPMAHGPLMVSGFLGTLISLERAVALGRRWAYTAPLLAGAGALLLVGGVVPWLGPLLMTLGSALLVGIFAAILRRQMALFTATMTLGALAWLVGNLLWLAGWPVFRVVSWWLGFLVITIAGERLELSRMRQLARRHHLAFASAVGLLLGGLVLSVFTYDGGMHLSGAGLAALALWLGRYDLARRTVRMAGLTRFIAVALLAGYVWLGIGGVLALILGGVTAGPFYDAMLHTVFVGFVISMVFAHAPIIFPALVQVPVPFQRRFYAHVALLHLSLIARVGGDLAGIFVLRRLGGLMSAAAMLLFLALTLRAARMATTTRPVIQLSGKIREQL